MRYGIIGKTLKHSFSAEIHPKLFDCTYEKWELEEGELDSFFAKKDFYGINVTIPYKQAVIPYLYELNDTAKLTGAVNTIINRNGKLYGFNTDFLGLEALIKKNNVDLKDKNVVIFGSGATSKTAMAVANKNGAKKVTRFSRTKCGEFELYENIKDYYDSTDVIINTTPCGMYPNNHSGATDISGFTKLCAVFDVVYNPIKTKLILDAEKMGVVAEGGTYMLVFQAVFAAELFCGKTFSKEIGDKIYNDILSDKKNVVLIGMPSCGKTVIGEEISKLTNRPFFDIDKEIEKAENMPVKEIIETNGIDCFRQIEKKKVFEISKNSGAVISTGGGVVLDSENISYLKGNGEIVFIDRDFEDLNFDNTRPLSNTKESLKKIYDERILLYKEYADITVCNDKSVTDVAKEIIKAVSL